MSDYSDTDWGECEEGTLPEKFWEELPRPLFWRVLVMPIKPVEKSRGGIVIPVEAQEAQKVLNYMGKVIALGPLAGRDKRLTSREDGSLAEGFPKPNEYIIYGRYSGQPVRYKGVKLLWINDDEILGTVPNPESLQVHI